MTRGNCGGCGAPVVWIKSALGENMICNAEQITSQGGMGLLLVQEDGAW